LCNLFHPLVTYSPNTLLAYFASNIFHLCPSARREAAFHGQVKQRRCSYEPKFNSHENFQCIHFITTNQPSPWSNIFLQKLTVAQLQPFTDVHCCLYKNPPSQKSYVTVRGTAVLSLLALHSNPTPQDHTVLLCFVVIKRCTNLVKIRSKLLLNIVTN
jgi:hypothetical protein